MCTLQRFHAVTDGYNDIKVVVFDVTFNIPISFFLNCRKFCDSCNLLKLPLGKDIAYMLTYGFYVSAKSTVSC